jgi:peptidoglycan/xylan/chitin deacetylase (PgdA/CDA1 family)
MKVGIALKSVIATALEYSGQIDKIFLAKRKSQYLILTYHRIIPSTDAPAGIQPGMYVEPKTFEMHVNYLKNHFQVVPFQNLIKYPTSFSMQKDSKPCCILTFDDGWFDFYKYAYPVLFHEKMPATVFLPTGYIDTNNFFWTDIIAYLIVMIWRGNDISKAQHSLKSELAKKIVGQRGTEESKVENAISILKEHDHERIFSVLKEISEAFDIAFASSGRAFLNWIEIREMFQSGLITFGSHTEGHKILVHLQDDEIKKELDRSKRKLINENVVNSAFIPFCFPNGNYNNRIVKLIEESGYHASVITEGGWNHLNDSIYKLRRISIHQDISFSRAMFECRLADII